MEILSKFLFKIEKLNNEEIFTFVPLESVIHNDYIVFICVAPIQRVWNLLALNDCVQNFSMR